MKETTFCWFVSYVSEDRPDCQSSMIEDLRVKLNKSLIHHKVKIENLFIH
jgi:hypothetical protein